MTSGPLRCQICGVLIGTYEPLIVLGDGMMRETSRASEPGLSPLAAEHYHSGCYDAQLEDYALIDNP